MNRFSNFIIFIRKYQYPKQYEITNIQFGP
jgi:hypothetical protein